MPNIYFQKEELGRGRVFTGCCPNPPVIKKVDTKKLKSAIMGENRKEDKNTSHDEL
jgi:hypothetical protein